MSEVFPNAPLVQAVFQLRFSGEIAVELARLKIQDAVRRELPKLYVPRAAVGVAPALQPYGFRSDDDLEGVSLAINSFSFHTSRYQGFSVFKQRFQRFYATFSEHVHVNKLNRIGLRYINHIPILRPSESAAIPLDDYLNIGFRLPPSIPANLTELNSAFSIRVDQGTVRMLLQHKKSEAPPQNEILILDFDYSEEDGLEVSRVEDYLERAHAHTKQIFLDVISEKYLPVMREQAK